MTREPTPVFELASRIIDGQAASHPIAATYWGIPGHGDRLTDWSPAADDARDAEYREWLRELDSLPIVDDDDRLAAAVIRERVGVELELHGVREYLRFIGVTDSPVQMVRDVFTLMDTETDDDWQLIDARLAQVPQSLASAREAYELGIAEGVLPARRQVLGAAGLADIITGIAPAADGEVFDWFATFVAGYSGPDERLRASLASSARAARAAYGDLAAWLRETYAPVAVATDGVGRERYVALARSYLGTDVDPVETYAWGWDDLAELTRRMYRCSARLYGGVSPQEAHRRLDVDPEHSTADPQSARDWLQQVTDETTRSFDGRYFDIPEAIRACQTMLAPAGAGAAPYYTSPSEDFARPGRTWLPDTGDRFGTWSLLSTWYHEAVPGHHLQIGYTLTQRERLSRFQRLHTVPGHAEGWALYAERLMDELGYFETPATELGFLAGQTLRAARVVVDIGLHLGLAVPDDIDPLLVDALPVDPRGQVWTRDLARDFIAARALLTEAFASSEADRYLAIPGQAICYKVGERVWLEAREAARARAGSGFDLKAWHMSRLALGSVGLALLADNEQHRPVGS